MADEGRIIEIEHPAWPEPLVIDLDKGDYVYDAEEDEDGRLIVTRLPRASLPHDRVAPARVQSSHQHPSAIVPHGEGLRQ